MITTVTGKNQITIPAKLARQLGIQPGQRIDWSVEQDGVLKARLLPSRAELARQAAGMGKAWLPEGEDPIAALIEERQNADDEEELTLNTCSILPLGWHIYLASQALIRSISSLLMRMFRSVFARCLS